MHKVVILCGQEDAASHGLVTRALELGTSLRFNVFLALEFVPTALRRQNCYAQLQATGCACETTILLGRTLQFHYNCFVEDKNQQKIEVLF